MKRRKKLYRSKLFNSPKAIITRDGVSRNRFRIISLKLRNEMARVRRHHPIAAAFSNAVEAFGIAAESMRHGFARLMPPCTPSREHAYTAGLPGSYRAVTLTKGIEIKINVDPPQGLDASRRIQLDEALRTQAKRMELAVKNDLYWTRLRQPEQKSRAGLDISSICS